MAGPPLSARDRLSQVSARARSRGPLEVLRWTTTSLRRALWSRTEIEFFARPGGGAHSHRDDIWLRPATPADAPRYAGDIGTDSERTFRDRLGRGQACYVVGDDERLVHSSWVTGRPVWMAEVRRYLHPPDGVVYIFESFTRPAARGRGIFTFAIEAISTDFPKREVWIASTADNLPSLQAIRKAGFGPRFRVLVHRKLGRARLQTSPEAESWFGGSV